MHILHWFFQQIIAIYYIANCVVAQTMFKVQKKADQLQRHETDVLASKSSLKWQ